MRRISAREPGFTLVELMVVILIIGILVAIAVPVFFNAEEDSERAACLSNLRTIDSEVVQYGAANGAFPADINSLVPDLLREVPDCPSGGVYSLDAGTPPRALCSVGHTY